MDIESRQIRHLAAIGQEGTFVGAAKALGISQPALSLSIQRLEDVLQTRLVERGRKGATLTEAGRLLARRSEEIDVTISAVIDEINLLAQGMHGKLRVGGTPLSTSSIIPATFARILELTKDVSIEIVEAVDEELLDLLDCGRLDVVVSAGLLSGQDADYDFTPLFEAKTVIAMRKGNPLAADAMPSLESLQDEVWAMPPAGGTFRRQIEALYTTHGLAPPKRLVQTASIATLLRIVRLTDAVSFVSEQLILDELEQGTLECVEISHTLAARVFGIITRKGRAPSNLTRLFCRIAEDLAPEFSIHVEARDAAAVG